MPQRVVRRSAFFACFVLLTSTLDLSLSAQWPQWRGPTRDGVVAAANVPAAWPAKPSVKWTQKVGEGYSTPVVANGRVYVHSRRDPDEAVIALDLATGQQAWTAVYTSGFNKNKYATSMSKGPFSTPVVANGVVYTLGSSAVLSAFDEKTGAVKWRKDWSKEIDTSRLFTGTAMSPIIDSGLLIVHVGDDDAGAFFALDPSTGTQKWTLPGHGPGYASPVVATFGATRQLVTMTDKAVVGVAIADGRELWKIPFPDEFNENIVTPVVAGDLLIVSAIRKGTLAYRISSSGQRFTATEVWHAADVPMYMSSPVVDGGTLYGFSNKRKGQLFAQDVKTGAVKWTTEGRTGANASLQIAGAHLVVLSTEGDLLIVKRNPEKYEELQRYKVAETQTWAQPVLLKDGFLIRDAETVKYFAF